MTPSSRERRLAYFSWITVCIVWGTTYFGIRVCLETMPPMLMGGLRWLLAGSLLAGYVVARGERLPARDGWAGMVLLGFLMLGLGNGGVVVAEQWVPSGLAAVIVASNPFWMAAVEAALPDGERLRPNIIAGLIIGFTGIVVLVWPDLMRGATARPGFVAGIIALQIASIGWSLGSSYARRHTRHESVLGMTACQMLAGGLMTICRLKHTPWSSPSATSPGKGCQRRFMAHLPLSSCADEPSVAGICRIDRVRRASSRPSTRSCSSGSSRSTTARSATPCSISSAGP